MFEHRLARKEVRDEGGVLRVPGTTEGGSLFLFLPSALPADPLQLTGGFLLSSHLRRGMGVGEGVRGCPLGVKPGASASVHKGIWRAWWKPPCYLVQAQRGASHASLPT